MKIFSGLKTEILTLFFLNPGSSFHVREIARRIDKSPRGALYELDILENEGFLTSKKVGNMRMFSLKRSFPGRESLKDLLLGYFGIGETIQNKISGLPKIDEAFIYGSLARGDFDTESDIDLFVVGGIKYEDIMSAMNDLEKSLGREVNVQLMTRKEYVDRKDKNDAYILDIEKNKKIYLIHDKKL